jgi:hypothetical protein
MNSEFAARMRIAISRLGDFCFGRLNRQTLLRINLPLILMSYFGSLILSIWLFPGPFDWRTRSMSKLLYPRNNPHYHFVAAVGIAVTGIAMIPFAGYIASRLRTISSIMASIGALIFGAGALSLICGALIVFQPYHDIFARSAGICLGLGMLVFYWCALRGPFLRANERETWRRTVLLWSLIVPPALLVVILRLLTAVHFLWPNPIYQAITNRSLWHLGFWEWIGSIAGFFFLLGATLYLPKDGGIDVSTIRRSRRP